MGMSAAHPLGAGDAGAGPRGYNLALRRLQIRHRDGSGLLRLTIMCRCYGLHGAAHHEPGGIEPKQGGGRALEAAGVVSVDKNAEEPGVRLRRQDSS